MSQHYSNPARSSDPYALPDVEVWQSAYQACPECDEQVLYEPLSAHTACPHCEHIAPCVPDGTGWFWWTCLPGCLPDSEPNGPFPTRANAIADAQSAD